MKLIDKYVADSEKDKPESKDKKVISDEAFAVCEFISELVDTINHRASGITRARY